MKNLIDLSGKKILVTGASSGFGRMASILLSQLGAILFLTGRNEEELKKTYNALEGEGHGLYKCDLSVEENIKELFEESILHDGKKLDGMVHCAGIRKSVPANGFTFSNIEETFLINYYSFLILTKFFSKRKYSEKGSIVVISSTISKQPEKCLTLYAASKAAINISVSCLAKELVNKGIRLNSILAGYANTPLTQKVKEELGDEFENHILKRQILGACGADDIANMAAFLLSDASKAITGRNIYVDGGSL